MTQKCRWLFATLLATSAVQAQVFPAHVQQALVRVGVPAGAVGAYVHQIGATQPILSHNADVPMNPASVMKLVTTYAALELLGPQYTWQTEAYAGARINGDVLEGDLHLRGTGDPKFAMEQFTAFVETLRARGIREIRGDLVLDRRYYENTDVDPGKFDNEPLKPYNVGPDPLLANFKSVRFRFVPDAGLKTFSVISEPKLAQVELVVDVRAARGGCGDWRRQLKADIRNTAAAAKIVFTGAIPASCGERDWYVGLLSHPEFTYGMFKNLWEEAGGTLHGRWRDGPAPRNQPALARAVSPPLGEIIRDVNKFSNNVMARQVFLTLSAELTKLPGRTDRSGRAVHSWLKSKGLVIPELVMENGSGLSRIERISAGGMVKMLIAAQRSGVANELIASLPVVGLDGTMHSRLRQDPVAGQAYLKGGGLNDVRTIAGYVRDSEGRIFVVAFFINHANAERAYPAQDAFLRWVYGEAGHQAAVSASATNVVMPQQSQQ
jgi:serine-type D-Ala-D-Ala carboxypeptidase/endopeptidase (penicillin-binding protein 4)